MIKGLFNFKLMISVMTMFKTTKVVFASLLIISSYVCFSQKSNDPSVEKSIFGIQTGLLGLWAHNELKLFNHIALRSEVGYGGVNTGDIDPLLALEPRWYYDFKKRQEKGRRIDGNSGNYISLRAGYRFFDKEDVDNRRDDYFLLTLNTGLRRNIGNHFNYEAGIGVGLGLIDDNGVEVGYTSYLSLKIGYFFKNNTKATNRSGFFP